MTPIVRASDLDVEGSATELLVAIVRSMGGGAYLAGGGAGGYQKDERFAEAGIEVIPQRFEGAHGLSFHGCSPEVPAALR